jgi:hypothetical protein
MIARAAKVKTNYSSYAKNVGHFVAAISHGDIPEFTKSAWRETG